MNENKMCVESDQEREALIAKVIVALQELPLNRLNILAKSLTLKESKTLSIDEAALELEVTPATIRKGIKNGTIKAIQINKAGKQRIPKEEITRFFTQRASHHD